MVDKKQKKSHVKLLALVIFISICTGLIGGIITNEYVVSYVFNKFVSGSEELEPIVKRVVEERVFVEESSVSLAIEEFKKSIVKAEGDDEDMFGEIAVTSDGVVMNFIEDVDENSPFVFKKIETSVDGEFLDVVQFADLEKAYKGQSVIGVGFDARGSLLITRGVIMNFHDEKSTIVISLIGTDALSDVLVLNFGGELLGVGKVTNEDVQYIQSVKVLEELLLNFNV